MVSKYSWPGLSPHRSRSSMAEWDPRTGKDSYSLDRAVSIVLAAASLSCMSPSKHTLSCKDKQSLPAALPSPPQSPSSSLGV